MVSCPIRDDKGNCCYCGKNTHGKCNPLDLDEEGNCCKAHLPDGTCCPCGRKQISSWPTAIYKCYPLHNGRCCADYAWFVHLQNGLKVVDFHCCECGVSFVNDVPICNPRNATGQCLVLKLTTTLQILKQINLSLLYPIGLYA